MRFRLVDRIHAWKAQESIQGLKAASFEECESQRELGRLAACPQTLLVESLFQLANWLILLSTNFEKIGLILSCRTIETLRPLRLGERMEIDVRWVSTRDSAALFEGEGRVGDELILRGRGCMAHLSDLSDFEKAADLKVLFDEIAPNCPTPKGGRPCPPPTVEA